MDTEDSIRVTDKDRFWAERLKIRPGPRQKAQLVRRLQRLYRQQGTYERLRAYLSAVYGLTASRQWLTDRIGTTPREPKKEDSAGQQPAA